MLDLGNSSDSRISWRSGSGVMENYAAGGIV